MPARQAFPETLSVLLDPQGGMLEAHGGGWPRHGDLGPWTWQELEQAYDIVGERWVKDDEYGQVKLLQLRRKQQ